MGGNFKQTCAITILGLPKSAVSSVSVLSSSSCSRHSSVNIQKRVLYVSDPESLHSIILRDQLYYEEASFILEYVPSPHRGYIGVNMASFSMNMMVFGPGLLSTLGIWSTRRLWPLDSYSNSSGHQHRKQRKMLNPVFSVHHLRQMTPIFYHVVQQVNELPSYLRIVAYSCNSFQLRQGIEKQLICPSGSVAPDIDVLNWAGRVALELIGQAGLGYSFDPLVEESKDSFEEAIKAIV